MTDERRTREDLPAEIEELRAPVTDLRHRGEVTGVFGCYEDITERKHAEAAERGLEELLRHVQRLESLGRLAGGVARDFNNLLIAILTNCDILPMKLERNGIESRELERVQRAGRRAAALTSQLLSFSRKQVIRPRVVDLNEIETRRVRMGELEAEGHPGMAPGAFVALRVSDTGAGMDAATMEHLFEPFFTTKDEGKGTGLGPATVYGVVRRAGGGIGVESESGRGTRVTVYLPESAGPVETAAAAGADAGAASNGGTILLVEDEDSVRASASEILRAGGDRVIAATDGEDALRPYEDHCGDVDLLVTDVVMPTMGGPEPAEALRRRAPNMKMLFVSGHTDDLLGEHGAPSPDVELLHTPFSRRPLLDEVREVLSAK